jgi:hypothetical protein
MILLLELWIVHLVDRRLEFKGRMLLKMAREGEDFLSLSFASRSGQPEGGEASAFPYPGRHGSSPLHEDLRAP